VAEIPFAQGRERIAIDNDENDDLPRLEDDSDDTLVSKPVDSKSNNEPKADEP
jgi:hypothetical protein